MRIEYITQARIPTEKAHGVQIVEMCRAFSLLGHEVTLVVPKRAQKGKDIWSAYDIEPTFKVRYVFVPDILTPWGEIGSWVSYLFSFLFLIRLLFYRPQRDALVYTRTPEISWLYSWRGYRTVCEIHDWPESHESLFRFFLRKTSLVVCNSPGVEKKCHENGLIKTFVAHNGVSLEMFNEEYNRDAVRAKLGIPKDKTVVMYVGSLEAWKGVETLFRVAESLPPSFQVVVIGGKESEVSDLKIQYPRVQFLGFRPYYELPENQQAADILVVPNAPSSIESQEYTSPLKLFAHMASGVPVLVSDLPSMRAIVSDNSAYFFKAGDSSLLARGIKSLLEDEERYKRAEEAKKRVQAFTWKARAGSILGILNTP